MKDIIDKLSSYNLFNYLFPGIVFVVISDTLFGYSFMQDNILVGIFLYYFIGMVISRIGSLVIEPLLKKISFLKFADYAEFVKTTKLDSKLELLSEVNNTYRTLCSLFASLSSILLYRALENRFIFLKDYTMIIVIVSLLILFLLSYRKQTDYIRKRIEAKN